MNGNLGLWLGILVLGLVAAYGNVQYFNQQTKMALVEQKLKSSTVNDLVDEYGNEDVKKVLLERAKLQEDLKTKTDELADVSQELENAKRKIQLNDNVFKENEEEQKTLKQKIDLLQKEASEAKKEAADFRKKAVRVDEAEELAEKRQKEVDSLSAEKDKLARDKDDLETKGESLKKSAKKRIQELQRDKYNLLTTISQKSDAVRQRMVSGSEDDIDGKILAIDLGSKFCVLDLGSINNVRRGMRFEVVRWVMNQWNVLATVEVRKVDYSTCDAVIIDQPAVVRECPVTGYVAQNPDERYSPYAADKENKVIPLVERSVNDLEKSKGANLIIVGDKVRNPLFERDKQLKFAFAGLPVISSIDILRNRIITSGNIFQEDKDDANCGIDIDTDFLILGKISENVVKSENGSKNDDELQYLKASNAKAFAEQYGIPIIREVSLNNFLK